MKKEEEFFYKTGKHVSGAEQGKLFGKPCFKVKGKAFSCFFEDAMVFKLDEASRAEALSLEDSRLFDPSGKGRPMKEWVQVPFSHCKKWEKYAASAADYVLGK